MKLILSGIFIHLILLGAIFDIYFKSPIIQGLQPQNTYRIPTAKRLVLIVADGLRAESLYGETATSVFNSSTIAPHLRSKIINLEAAWGISHTRVPTESRPGHVALIAGIYEDPSAVARGWKENPVEFDSVFNHSSNTWAWGSPDIILMFKKLNNFHGYSYSPEEEDFSGKISTTLLDTWVFDRVETFLRRDLANDYYKEMHCDKMIFFLHLLGLDTAGHVHKPGSKLHEDNLRLVDKRIHSIENYFNSYFPDNKTVFIFTSDHGMTNWGSHGAGSLHETETPFIAWGAGIKPTKQPIEIAQADVTPLISALLGMPIPVNSIGLLPTKILNLTKENLAHAFYANAKQIFVQFDEKRLRTEENSISVLYKPYPEFSIKEFRNVFSTMESSLHKKDFDYVMKSSESIIKEALRGLDYYQNYYRRLLLGCTSFAYIGWIFYVIIYLTDPWQNSYIHHAISNSYVRYNRFIEFSRTLKMLFIIVVVLTWAVLYAQSLPSMFYVYCTLPLYIWWKIAEKSDIWIRTFQNIIRERKKNNIFLGIIYLIGIETLIMSFFYRQALSLSLAVIAFWPYNLQKVYFEWKCIWFLSCITLAIFPFLPVVGSTFNFYFIAFTGVLWILVNFILYFTAALSYNSFISKRQMYLAITQSMIIVCAVCNLYVVDESIKSKNGLVPINQFTSWALSGASLILAFCGSDMIVSRLVNITMSLLVPFILLSVSYEPLFLFILFTNLMLWLCMEHTEFSPIYLDLSKIRFSKVVFRKYDTYDICGEDFRRGFFIVLYVILGFFGMGNMASINSFDPMWVRNFVSVFSPFTMTILILFKIVIPYLVISCVFRAVTVCLQASTRKMFFVVLIFCDIMGLHFLFMVKNYGSWLEIGSSISHYVIVQTMVLFLLLLHVIATVLTDFNFSKYLSNSYKVHRR